MIAKKRYSMSFTAGGLLHRESVIVTGLFLELGDWPAVKRRVLAENSLQMRTSGAAKRICEETIGRLRRLTPGQLQIVGQGSLPDQVHVLWLAICKRYRFIRDFAVEVIREKWLRHDIDLAPLDFDIFLSNKAEWDEALDRLRPATRRRQQQIVFQMLREAGILSAQKQILPVALSPVALAAVRSDPEASFSIFPNEHGGLP